MVQTLQQGCAGAAGGLKGSQQEFAGSPPHAEPLSPPLAPSTAAKPQKALGCSGRDFRLAEGMVSWLWDGFLAIGWFPGYGMVSWLWGCPCHGALRAGVPGMAAHLGWSWSRAGAARAAASTDFRAADRG